MLSYISNCKAIILCGFLFCMNAVQASAVTLSKQRIEFAPKQGGDKVSFEFLGQLNSKSTAIKIDGSSPDKIAKFLHKTILANSNGAQPEILNTWTASERAKIQSMMVNPTAFSNNQAFFRNIKSSRLLGVIKYGEFYLTFVLHDIVGMGEYVKQYPLVLRDDEFYLSNALEGDFFYTNLTDQLSAYKWPK